jgi:hypothetical protein
VSSYLAFSTLPAGIAADRRYIFCDTFHDRALASATSACFTRHAAVWCSDFPLANISARQRSSAIAGRVTGNIQNRNDPAFRVNENKDRLVNLLTLTLAFL